MTTVIHWWLFDFRKYFQFFPEVFIKYKKKKFIAVEQLSGKFTGLLLSNAKLVVFFKKYNLYMFAKQDLKKKLLANY